PALSGRLPGARSWRSHAAIFNPVLHPGELGRDRGVVVDVREISRSKAYATILQRELGLVRSLEVVVHDVFDGIVGRYVNPLDLAGNDTGRVGAVAGGDADAVYAGSVSRLQGSQTAPASNLEDDVRSLTYLVGRYVLAGGRVGEIIGVT